MNPNPQKSETAQKEESLLQFWREHKVFQKTLEKTLPNGKERKEYIFYEGPPGANGKPMLHHFEARAFKDVIPRYKTMRGFRVDRRAGWDCHGLPVELQAEKELGLKSKKEIESYGIAQYNEYCKQLVTRYTEDWEVFTDRMGYWIDNDRAYYTMDNTFIESSWNIIKEAHARGHLYKDFKVVPWCARCGTGLSSHELNQPGAYKDVKDLSVFAKFPIVGFEKAYFLAWTTTPWTLPGNVALAVGADIDYVEAKVGDEIVVVAKDLTKILPEGFEIIAEHKGSEMVGMKYEPLYPFMKNLAVGQEAQIEKAYQIYAADFVTTTDGTGIVHTAVMYGADDFELGTKIGLPKFHLVGEDGKFVSGCDTETLKLSGRFVKEKSDGGDGLKAGDEPLAIDIIKDLAGRGLLFKKEKYEHSYPHCWRCDTPLIYYARSSWYFGMSKLRQELLDSNATINWEPNHIKDGRFGEWLDGIKDWAISRDRYWGTPLPVWQTSGRDALGNPAPVRQVVIGGLDDLKKYTKRSGNTYIAMRHGQAHSNVSNTWDCGGDPENHLTDLGRDQATASAEAIKKHVPDGKVDLIIASPFLRTTETAKIVAEHVGAEVIFDERLAEWNVGTEFDRKSLDYFFDVRNKTHDRYAFEAHGGESFAAVVKRVGDFIYDIESRYQNKTIVIVGHGSSIRALEMLADGFTYEELLVRSAKHDNYKNAEFREINFIPTPHNERYEIDLHKPFIDNISLHDPETGEELVRAPEVMDVWFDSGAMPLAQSHYPFENKEFIDTVGYPADFICEAIDQTRGWFYTLVAVATLIGRPAPFKNVICLGHILDAKGQKMSKSKGNAVDSWDIMNTYGADALRFWMYTITQPGDSKNFSMESLDEVNKKVFNILRNIVSFYEMYKTDENLDSDEYNPYRNRSDGTANILDTWILAKLDELSITVTRGLDTYDIFGPARAIRDFITEFSTWYIRRSRDRFKSENEMDRKLAMRTTQIVLRHLALIMAPFTPFISEEIWQKVKWDGDPESVHLGFWIDRGEAAVDWGTVIADMDIVRELVTVGMAIRQDNLIKVKQPLASLYYTSSTKSKLDRSFEALIADELNIKNVVWSADLPQEALDNPKCMKGSMDYKIALDTTITDTLRDEGDMREFVRTIQDMRKNANLVPSDRVVASLTHVEPSWFAGELGRELMQIVGADRVEWGSSENMVQKI